ncbi:MAG: hypothetical protein HXY44_19425 [Syntrophaceae bacterium]|nr:hypothetical protein [Syntrophaceae bacterium]
MDFPLSISFDEVFSQLALSNPEEKPISPRKVLFRGVRTGEIASYVAAWLAGKGIEVIVLDGANRFNPYTASSFARKACIPPERLLKRIHIARAFTCYQMAVMIVEKLPSLLITGSQKPWIILLGPITTFLDEDVPEGEVRPLFEKSLKKIEEMALRGIPFLLFQSDSFSNSTFPFPPKGRMGELRNSKRTYLMKRLFQFTNEIWRINLDDEGPKIILEKKVGLNIIENCKLPGCLADRQIL